MPQRRRRKRLGTSTAPDTPNADAPNRVWAVDFQFDATTDGRPIKIVSIVDEHTRECLGGLVERSITADVLIDELDRLATNRGYPAVLRCDNGPELACTAMADWAGERVGLSFIPPGEPWRNGYVESFNSRVRDECLNINIFWSLAHARVVITDWKERIQSPSAALSPRLPGPSSLCCRLHPPMNDTHKRWTSPTVRQQGWRTLLQKVLLSDDNGHVSDDICHGVEPHPGCCWNPRGRGLSGAAFRLTRSITTRLRRRLG